MRLFDRFKSLFFRAGSQKEHHSTQSPLSSEDRVKAFIASRMDGQDAPKDLSALLSALSKDAEFENSGKNPLNAVGAQLLWADQKYPLLDHNYLNDVDRADPDIMANVKAMQDVSQKLKFVVQCEDTYLIGYWQPDPTTPLEKCALFWLDTEGQYYLTEGKTLSETFAYRALIDGQVDAYQSVLQTFEQLGVKAAKSDEKSIFEDMDSRERKIEKTPESFRMYRYKHYLSL